MQAEKLATRMSRIFEAAKVHKWCSGNPASRETVKALLGTVERPEGHFKSLPYKRIPKLMMQLQGIDTEASMGLQLMILTAARTCEIRAASWGEFDLEARTWNVPAPHMKGKIAHSVFLNLPAMEILEQLHSTTGVRGRLFSFGQHAMKELARELTGDDGLTGHGMRASFRTWAEAHDFADRIIEDSLAHKDKNRTRRAYRRPEELFEKRAKMLMAWGNYCRSDFKGRDKLLAAAEAKEHADLNKLLGNAEMNKPRLRIVK